MFLGMRGNESQSLIHQVSVSEQLHSCYLSSLLLASQSLIHQVSVSEHWVSGSNVKRLNFVSIPYSSGLSFRDLVY